jgi:hypothetical protein
MGNKETNHENYLEERKKHITMDFPAHGTWSTGVG